MKSFQRGATLAAVLAVAGGAAMAGPATPQAAARAALARALARDSGAAPGLWIEHKATEPGGAGGDEFGYAVAISGTTAVVGAAGADGSAGAAYVFTRANGSWSESQALSAADGAGGDEFGFSVSLSGATLVIGAPYASVGGNGGEGAAYVFTESGGTWSQAQKLVPSDGASNYNFGWSVAVSGSNILAAAPVAPVDGNALAGAAYVFTESGGTWSQAQKLTANDVAAFADFGYSVSIDGSTALIGASGLASYTGAAYVFAESGGSWSQTAELVPDDAAALEFFGISVSVSGSTALVGAYYQDEGSNAHQGAAYVFGESGGSWSQMQKLTAADGAAGDRFGLSVNLGDDAAEAVVGAYYASVGANSEQGAAYVFTNSGGTWSQAQKFTASDGAAGDNFGNAVAISGRTALAAAFNAAVGGNAGEGVAYFYDGADLDLALSAPASVGQGEDYTAQTIATNNASAASPAVAVTVAVPAAASFVSASSTQGSCGEDADVVTCAFGQITGNGGSATANVTLEATGNSGTTIENTASVAHATPALTAAAPTAIASCGAGYTEHDGTLAAGAHAIEPDGQPYEAPAGMENGVLTAPAGFTLYVAYQGTGGRHIYRAPGNELHHYGPAGHYAWIVKAGDAGGDFSFCLKHP